MELEKFGNVFDWLPKSKTKAGEGLDLGEYPFYTSSSLQKKWLNKSHFFSKALIFGTGGNASLHFVEGRFSVSTDCVVAKKKKDKGVSIKYIYYYLKANIHLLEKGFRGAGLKHISKKYIENLEIPLPLLEEQDRIVTILDKVQSLIDKRENSIQYMEDLQKAIFYNMFGDPIKELKKHDPKILNDVILKIDAGWSPICEEISRTNDSEIGILKQSAITKRCFISEQNKRLPANTIIKKHIYAEKGDLLFSRKNTRNLVGSTVYLFEEYRNLLVPDTIFNIRYDKSKISGIYLFFLFNDLNFRNKIQEISSGAIASMVNVSQKKLNNLKIAYPDYEKQIEFEEIIKKIQENTLLPFKTSHIYLLQLFKSLSQRAFSGNISYDIDVELDALINIIEIEKSDIENDISILSKDKTLIQRLLNRLSNQEFVDIQQYDKAKYAIFRIMNEDKEFIEQKFDDDSITLNLS